MRRQDKAMTDPAELAAVLDGAEWGTLGLVSAEGEAVLVPLNFIHLEGRICFHGAQEGQKMELIRAGARASFLVVEALALLPSYLSDPENACPATQLFKSVIAYGPVAVIQDPERKAAVLEAIMGKLQPEGGYAPIRAGDPRYQARLQGTAVLEMTIERMSGKFGVGQKLTPERRAAVGDFLTARGGAQDPPTVAALKRYGRT